MAKEIFEELKDWLFWLLGNGKIIEKDKTKPMGAKGEELFTTFIIC